MDLRNVGEAGLVGLRGRVGARAARWLSGRTPLDERTVAALIGGYLFFSRTRRMVEMLRRLRRGA
jgi:hypothetical protein